MLRDDIELLSESNWRGVAGLKTPFYRRTWFSALLVFVILVVVCCFGVFLFMVKPLREKAAIFDLGEIKRLEAASILFDRDGGELARLYMLNRTPVSITEVPNHLIDALTAQEDSRFFQHKGVDYIGLVRAAIENFKAGEVTQGASTITQQLARQSFNLLERTYKRKILEAFVAQRIEKDFSKTEILELYLNRIYFGAGYYGVQAAAQGYFGKDAKDLNIEESATIVGLIKSPNRLSPLRHPEESIVARNVVIARMVEERHLSRDEGERLMQKPLVTATQSADPRLTYVFEEVRQQVVKMVGEERAAVGGFLIYTTIDPALQKSAEEAVNKRLGEVETRADYPHQKYAFFQNLLADYKAKLKAGAINPETPRPVPEYLQGAALVLDNRDGSVLAMVGGRNFVDSQYNRALASQRPAGTAFTPFVFAAAFSRKDFHPGTQLEDAPIDNRRVMIGGLTGILGEWGTEVEESRYAMAPISAREALVNSRNAATVRMGERIGVQPVRDLAAAAGIRSTLRDYPSTFLGASEVRLDEMCLAYSVFPNRGRRPKDIHLIHRITDAADKVVFQIAEDESERAMDSVDPIAAYQTHSCLVEALRRGTGSPAAAEFGLADFLAGGKTGTHYEFKDLLFMGYTSAVTCGVWVGFDKQKPIYTGAFSNRIALPIWSDIMNASLIGHPAEDIPPPEGAERVELCRKSGLRATDFCYEKVRSETGEIKSVRSTYVEYMRPGSSLEGFCTVHTGSGAPMGAGIFASLSANPVSSLHPDLQKFAHVEPVRMQGLTVLGSDPYHAQLPILRPDIVAPDGTTVKRPEIIDSNPLTEEESPIKLAPPPPLKIEIDENARPAIPVSQQSAAR